jgi:TPR repeat protein
MGVSRPDTLSTQDSTGLAFRAIITVRSLYSQVKQYGPVISNAGVIMRLSIISIVVGVVSGHMYAADVMTISTAVHGIRLGESRDAVEQHCASRGVSPKVLRVDDPVSLLVLGSLGAEKDVDGTQIYLSSNRVFAVTAVTLKALSDTEWQRWMAELRQVYGEPTAESSVHSTFRAHSLGAEVVVEPSRTESGHGCLYRYEPLTPNGFSDRSDARRKSGRIGSTAPPAETSSSSGTALPDAYSETAFELGKTHDGKSATEADLQEAVRYYRLAAQFGHAGALYRLGRAYALGLGVEANAEMADSWYEAAYRRHLDDADTHDIIGFMLNQYADELCGTTDIRTATCSPDRKLRALRWRRLGGEAHGNILCLEDLGTLYVNGDVVQRDYREAARLLKLAVAQGSTSGRSLRILGYLHENGLGMEKDILAAMDYYRRVAVRGDTQSMVRLGVIYWAGSGVPRNTVEAGKWILVAAERGNADARKLLSAYKQEVASEVRDEAEHYAKRLRGEIEQYEELCKEDSDRYLQDM